MTEAADILRAARESAVATERALVEALRARAAASRITSEAEARLAEARQIQRTAEEAAAAATRVLDAAMLAAQTDRVGAKAEARRIVEEAFAQSAAIQEELLAELDDEIEHRLGVIDLQVVERLAQADRDAAEVIEQADRVAAGILANARVDADAIHGSAPADGPRTSALLIADARRDDRLTSSAGDSAIDLDAEVERACSPFAADADHAVVAAVSNASPQRTTRLAASESAISRQHRLEVEERCAALVAGAEAAARYRIVSAEVGVSERLANADLTAAQRRADAEAECAARLAEADAAAERRLALAEQEHAERLAAADAVATQRLLDAHQEASTILERAKQEASTRRATVPASAAPVGEDREDRDDRRKDDTPGAAASRRRRRRGPRLARTGRALMIILAVLVPAVLLRVLVAQPYTVSSTSMTPALEQGDRVLIYKQAYRFGDPARGDVVVFDTDELSGAGGTVVKRVIALPGEIIEGHSGNVYVDGQRLVEPYLDVTIDTPPFPPVKVPQGSVFVLGDNRGPSLDSRAFGPVLMTAIVGRAGVVMWPLSHVGWV